MPSIDHKVRVREILPGMPPRYRWHLGCILLKMPAVSLPTGPERIAANAELFHFEIAPQDLARLGNMDRGLALAWGAGDPCLTP